ncbi:MAG: cytochrome c-type biogenesis protein CcmH [Rhodobiaceae bacterium]|nr:cytochrome c-type biogenesis protein CcmH [Rhodobiaceae bacterium]
MIRLTVLLVMLLFANPAAAVDPGERLDDPVLEERARGLSQELRCLVCQNQSIDDSDAPLAKDLRVLVRDRLKEGDTDAEVLSYIVDRYGEFVLLRPPLRAGTVLLWLAPFIVLIVGIASVLVYVRSRRPEAVEAPAPLSDAEKARLEEIVIAREPRND